MSFGSSFEKKVNDNLREEDGQPGRAPAEFGNAEMEVKKKGQQSPHLDIEDEEIHDKKDRPPRFSTLFGAAPPPPPPPPREYVREYYPKPERKSGVFMPMPLFVIFAVILFFESTILFAYTVIGLYNNAPSRIFPWAGPGTAAAACNCGEPQPAINIAPNFVIPGQQGEVTQFVTISEPSQLLPSTTSASSTTTSSSTSTTSASTSTTNTAAAAASDIAGILGGLGESSSSSKSVVVVTVAPAQGTVTSVKLITEDASGNVVSNTQATVFSTTFIDPPAPTSTSSESK